MDSENSISPRLGKIENISGWHIVDRLPLLTPAPAHDWLMWLTPKMHPATRKAIDQKCIEQMGRSSTAHHPRQTEQQCLAWHAFLAARHPCRWANTNIVFENRDQQEKHGRRPLLLLPMLFSQLRQDREREREKNGLARLSHEVSIAD